MKPVTQLQIKAESLVINSIGHRPMADYEQKTLALKGRNQFDIRPSA